MDNQSSVSRLYKKYVNQKINEWAGRNYSYPVPNFTPIENFEVDFRCGARTKSTGQPCKRKDIYSNGRCKLHGGLSTGPRTLEGKKKSAQNGFKK